MFKDFSGAVTTAKYKKETLYIHALTKMPIATKDTGRKLGGEVQGGYAQVVDR